MKKSVLIAALPFLFSGQAMAQDKGSLNIICSVQAEWCNMLSNIYQRTEGVKVNMTMRSTGEALAQIVAEKANPKTDLWFGGTGDPHLQLAEQNLSLQYQSPLLPRLHDWAKRQAELSGYKTVGLYLGPLGFSYNSELIAKRKLPLPQCWKDLLKPEFKGEIQMANPATSGTAYTAIATLVQVLGEDAAFDYMRALHANISQYTRSGTGPLKNSARGENAVGISFIADVPGEAMQGFPVKAITPCEGTGYEIGSMSIVKGAPHEVAAKKFYDWALTPATQETAAAAKQFEIPSNKAAQLHPNMPNVKDIKLINYDAAKFGQAAERKRLLAKWESTVNNKAK